MELEKQNSLLAKLVVFLSQKPFLNGIIILVYAYLIIFLHDPLVQHSVAVMQYTGIPGYNTLITVITLLAVSFLGFYIWSNYKRNSENWRDKLKFSLLVLGLLFVHYRFLLEMNIEIIHAFAYGLWFIPLIAFFRSPSLALVVALPFMLFDEWYQYQVLYPHYVQYWELNDVLLNVLGCLFMLALMKWSDVESKKEWRWSLSLLLAYFLMFTICVFLGFFAVTIDDANPYTVLIINKLSTFNQWWQIHPLTQKEYVVVGWKSFWFVLFVLVFLDRIFKYLVGFSFRRIVK